MPQARAVTELGDGEEAVLVRKVEGVVGQQRHVLVLLWKEYSGGHTVGPLTGRFHFF